MSHPGQSPPPTPAPFQITRAHGTAGRRGDQNPDVEAAEAEYEQDQTPPRRQARRQAPASTPNKGVPEEGTNPPHRTAPIPAHKQVLADINEQIQVLLTAKAAIEALYE
jgi:hypothetical protein